MTWRIAVTGGITIVTMATGPRGASMGDPGDGAEAAPSTTANFAFSPWR
jgi:hypothetical protein